MEGRRGEGERGIRGGGEGERWVEWISAKRNKECNNSDGNEKTTHREKGGNYSWTSEKSRRSTSRDGQGNDLIP